MKFKFKLAALAVVTIAAFAACERDLVIDEAEFSDIAFTTSEFRSEVFTVNAGNFITFSDLSVNAVEHAWTITEGSAFLEGPLERNDTILEPFIIPDAGLVSEDAIVNVLFREGGLKTVNLRNAFKDSVSYRTSTGNISAVKEGNLFVFDTTFVVDVYDTIVPIIDIRQGGISVPFRDSTDVITIEAGDVLEFVDLSVKDRVTTRAWRIENNGFVNDSVGEFQFNRLGEFKGMADFTRSGENIPFDFERYEIPATFRVVPSSKPFVLSGDIVELENEIIQIPFNGEFAPFGSQEEFFTVTLNNDDGSTRELGISSIDRNDSNNTLLEITLNEPIYRPDNITVSYSGGSLESTDTRSPVEFTDVPVVMHDVNLLEGDTAAIYSFEGAAAQLAWTENDQSSATSVEFTTERASEGTTSLKWTSEAGSAMRLQCAGETFGLPAGTYQISYDLFLEEGNTFAATVLTIFNPFSQKWTNANPYPRGEWVKVVRNDFVIGADTEAAYLFLRTEGGAGTAYMDNWRIVQTEVRP